MEYPYKARWSGSKITSNELEPAQTQEVDPESIKPPKSKRARKKTNLGPDFYTDILDNDPSIFREAMQFLDATFQQRDFK